MRALPRRLTAGLLLAVLAICIYRARTQSFTIDEAWVFERFVDRPLVEMAKSWDSCNHVLHTLLMKFCRDKWGISEHVLRIPSLLGAVLYLTAVFRLTGLLFSGWRQPLAAALLVLHPLVLDLMVAARGYGLALGLFTWAVYCVVCYCVKGWDKKWLSRAGVLAGLAVAANLTFAVPVTALGAALWWMRRSSRTADGYFGPAIVIAAIFLVLPTLNAVREDFYFGESDLLYTFSTLYGTALKSEHSALNGLGWAFAPYAPLAAAAFCSVLGASGLWWLWRRRHERFVDAPFAVVGGTTGICAVTWLILDLSGVPCPSGRTGVYFIPLVTLSAMLLWRQSRTALLVGAFAAAFYLTETDNRYFGEWRWDAGTRDLIRRCDEDRFRRKLAQVRLGVPESVAKTVRYYVLRRRTPWMAIVPANDPDAHYLLLDRTTALAMSLAAYETVAFHEWTGAVLLRPLR